MNIGSHESKRIAQIRMSTHQFNVETGRYGYKRSSRLFRICGTCSTKDQNILTALNELPFFEPVIEDELHILRTCTLYDDLRSVLSDQAKTALFADMRSFLSIQAKETGRYLLKIWKRRFPERFKSENEKAKDKPDKSIKSA